MLRGNGINEDTIVEIASKAPPFELVFSGIWLQTWNPDKEMFYIMALVESNKISNKTENDNG
jgi:hypothetical protein